MPQPAYKRVLLKLSGESLVGEGSLGIDLQAASHIVTQVQQIASIGVQVGVVIGGGNIFRGAKAADMARTPADQIGMLATLINGISLQQAFEKIGCESRIMSAIACDVMAEAYSWKQALDYLNQGIVLIFVGGTGNPYFTTDSAAALRALEIQADILLKGTKVNGVFDKDPAVYPDAKPFERITYDEVFEKRLNVMDMTAIALCRENQIPVRVFDLFSEGAMMKAVCNQSVGTMVS